MSFDKKLLDIIQKESKRKSGLICLTCLLFRSSMDDLNSFIKRNSITISEVTKEKIIIIKDLASHFYDLYINDKSLKKQFPSFLDYFGQKLVSDDVLKNNLYHFDFVSKQELIEKFADFCADLGISVYTIENDTEYNLDVFLIRRTPLLRTEAVFVLTGHEINEDVYRQLIYNINHASSLAVWTVVVTTPLAIYKIGYEKLVRDMQKFGVWLYSIDPSHNKILGITKGKKSKDFDDKIGDQYIEKMVKEPIRAPSQTIKISKYSFNESDSYNPKNFNKYEFFPETKNGEKMAIPLKNYDDIFKNLMVIENESGIPIFSLASEASPTDDTLVSGFLTAMDNFISELGGSSAMEDINYKGFYIQAAYGKNIKIVIFLSKPSDKILKERLVYLVKRFEEDFGSELKKFTNTGNVSFFTENLAVLQLIRNILRI